MTKRFWVAMGIMALVTVGLVAWNVMAGGDYRFQGAEITPARAAADFSLTDQHQQSFRLGDQQGKVVLLSFGYTTCPDVCPVTLAEFHNIRIGLGKQAEQVVFVFISVDPERDTPERLGEHLAIFDPEIIGLTGETSELEAVWADYGIAVGRNDEDTATGYLVDHTTRSFLIDQAGNLRVTYPFGTPAGDILGDIEHLLDRR